MLPKVCAVHNSPQRVVIDDGSGFSPLSIDDEYLCTSAITTPMAFLLDPNISTADIYTTLPPELWIEHDQVTVQWEPSDLELFPVGVASQYALMMGITAPPSMETATETIEVGASSPTTSGLTLTSGTSVSWSVPTTSGTATSEIPISAEENESQLTRSNGGILPGLCGSAFVITILVGIVMGFVV